MSMPTPPGWYPDPGVPSLERWWDGTAWTAHTRMPGGGEEQGGGGARHGSGGGTAGGGGGKDGRNGGLLAVFAVGVALVVAVAVGVTLLGDDEAGTRPSATGGDTPPPSTPAAAEGGTGATPSGTPGQDATVLVDQLNGITLPIPDGWEIPRSTTDGNVTMSTTDTYECPGDSGRFCPWGRVTTRTVTDTDETSPRALAEQDISRAADTMYEENAIGDRLYGRIVSHTVVTSGPAVVANRSGYLVRWQVRTKHGPGGYVQSLVFPSARGSESPVVVRFAFDKGPESRTVPPGMMDTITEGIRPIGDVSGGVGSSIGP
ncbi:DUF2510 domain-containing protein [Streptomyces sp. NPDC004749]